MAQVVRASPPGVCRAGRPWFEPQNHPQLVISIFRLVMNQFYPLFGFPRFGNNEVKKTACLLKEMCSLPT